MSEIKLSMNDLVYKEKSYAPEKEVYAGYPPKQLYELYYNKELERVLVCISWTDCSCATPKDRGTYLDDFNAINKISYTDNCYCNNEECDQYCDHHCNNGHDDGVDGDDPGRIEWCGSSHDFYEIVKNKLDMRCTFRPINFTDINYESIENLYNAFSTCYQSKTWSHPWMKSD